MNSKLVTYSHRMLIDLPKSTPSSHKQSYKKEQNHWKTIAKVGNNPIKINEIIGKPLQELENSPLKIHK